MKTLPLIAGALLSLISTPFAANLLVNPGFESPITTDGPPFVGSWEGFAGDGASAINGTTQPRTGTQHLTLNITTTPNSFTGAFQDVAVLTGTQYTFSGWQATPSSPLNAGVELRIEWRNATSEVSRTPNSTPVPSAAYSAFSLTATAPAGADTARVVFAIQSFSTAPLGNGSVFVDDLSFEAVPEPSGAALLGLSGLLLANRRRQRAR